MKPSIQAFLLPSISIPVVVVVVCVSVVVAIVVAVVVAVVVVVVVDVVVVVVVVVVVLVVDVGVVLSVTIDDDCSEIMVFIKVFTEDIIDAAVEIIDEGNNDEWDENMVVLVGIKVSMEEDGSSV